MLRNNFEGAREALPTMRKWVRDSLNVLVDSSKLDYSTILIAVGEVLQNCVRYGFENNQTQGRIRVTIYPCHYGLIVDIEDDAPPSDPSKWSVTKSATDGGLGLLTIKNATAAVTFRATIEGNFARLVFSYPDCDLPKATAAWVGDIFASRQNKFCLEDRLAEASGIELTNHHRRLFRSVSQEIFDHIKANRDALFYHDEWHVQDVVISIGHLFRGIPQLDAVTKLEAVLAAAFHDHLHPGVAALRELKEPIEITSALKAEEFLREPRSSEFQLPHSSIEVIGQLIRSTEPKERKKLVSNSNDSDASLYRQKILLNDADIMTSYIPALGINLARSVKYEALTIERTSTELYQNFVREMTLITSQAKELVAPFRVE